MSLDAKPARDAIVDAIRCAASARKRDPGGGVSAAEARRRFEARLGFARRFPAKQCRLQPCCRVSLPLT